MRKRFDISLLPPRPNLEHEGGLWAAGIRRVAGIDEAGRGALAGPVAAGAVILPTDHALMETLRGVDDSKQMTAKSRRFWSAAIREAALGWAVGYASNEEIDEMGILPATRLAAMRALAKLRPAPEHLLLDALSLRGAGLPETSLVKGDARALSIACASVLAKVARDDLLCELDREYPVYGFAAHKGYGTGRHRAALTVWGPSPAHRRSFAPLRQG